MLYSLIFKEVGLNGPNGPFVMKMGSSTVAVTVKSTIQDLPSVPGTAHNTKTACTTRSLVGSTSPTKQTKEGLVSGPQVLMRT